MFFWGWEGFLVLQYCSSAKLTLLLTKPLLQLGSFSNMPKIFRIHLFHFPYW